MSLNPRNSIGGLLLLLLVGGSRIFADAESDHHCNGDELEAEPAIETDSSGNANCPHHTGNYHDDTVWVSDKDTGYHCSPPAPSWHYMDDATNVSVYEINSGTLYDSHAMSGGVIFCIEGTPSGQTDKFDGWDEGLNENHENDSSLDGTVRITLTW